MKRAAGYVRASTRGQVEEDDVVLRNGHERVVSRRLFNKCQRRVVEADRASCV